MNATIKGMAVMMLALGALSGTPDSAMAQQPAGYEFYGHYPDAATANRIAAALSSGQDSRYDAGWAEAFPNPVTRTYGVYGRPRRSGGPGPSPSYVQHGSITKGHPLDRFRNGSHAAVHMLNLNAGQTYTIDLTSPAGPAHVDMWLRIEDAAGNVLANDDDSGDGLNARVTFTPQHSGSFRIVATTFRSGATGNYTLSVR